MKILVAPNSMKGSLDAFAFAQSVEQAFRKVSPLFEVRTLPVADGGDFTAQVLRRALSAVPVKLTVSDPLMRRIEATYFVSGKTAIIEMSDASGLKLLSDGEANPEKTSSFGTGEMIAHAVANGCNTILLGIGGSATVDGGLGMLDALGFQFSDASGNRLPGVGASLEKVAAVIPVKFSSEISIKIICDVENPLLGAAGAARIFGPQKGADPEMVERLEAGMTNWAGILEASAGIRMTDRVGMGAAGGISTGLVAWLGAEMVEGADFIFDLLNLDEQLGWADWVITGEGKIDGQSLGNKAPVALARRARAKGKPVTALAGTFEPQATHLFDGVFPVVTGPVSLREAMSRAEELVFESSCQLARLLLQAATLQLPGFVQLRKAETLLEQNQVEAAEALLDSGLPENLAGYWYLRGLLEQKKQQLGAAINCYLRCQELDPGHAAAAHNQLMVRQILSFWNPDLYNP